MCISRCRFVQVVLLLTIGLMAAVGAQAFPVRMLNVKDMLASSDAVYKVSVQSTREQGVWKNDPAAASLRLPQVIAKVQVISAIKGTARGTLEVTFPGFPHANKVVFDWPMYTGLSARRTYIVFLKGSSSPYRFADLQTGAMIVPARTPAVAYGSKPVDRLLAELVSAARIGDEAMRRVAVEQLGKLGDIRAAAVLRELSKSKDLARRTSALVARIEVGDAPAEADLLAILRMDPASSKSRVGMSTGVAGPFFAGAEQVQIVQAISRSVKPSGSFTGRAAKQLNGFDYIDFVTQTLSYKVIKEHDILRSDLVGTLRDLGDPKSMPLLLKLLNDHSKAVRYMAATSFAVLAKNNKWYVAGDIFNKNEAKYIKQCREWAKQHPGGI